MQPKTKTIHINGWFRPYVTPPIPDKSEILGYNLPKKEQMWENCRPYLPSDDEAENMTKAERVAFIKRELERRIYGCWFTNNGEETYLTGDYYFYLTYWFIGALTETGLPEYRSANRDWMYVVDDCEKDPNCFGAILLCQKRDGKSLSISTLVPTTDGWKAMKDIQVGDYVFGYDGKPTRVTWESGVMYNKECYKLTFSDGTEIVADKDHLWVAADAVGRTARAKSGRYIRTQVVTTEQMSKSVTYDGKHSNWSIENCKPVHYDKKDLPIPPYIFGLWLGDGAKDYAQLTTMDKEIEEAWFEYGVSIGLEPYSYGIQKRLRSGRKVNNRFTDTIKSMGVYKNKHIPDCYLQSSVEDRIELLQGLMDSDGTCEVSKKKNSWSFCNKDKKIVDGFVELIASLGIKSTTSAYKHKGEDDFTYYVKFVSYDIQPFKLERKKAKENELTITNSPSKRRFIRSIEKVESVPVKCIEVEAYDRLYLVTKNFIPTHNTERHISTLYNRATTIDENCLFGMQSLNATEAKKNLFIGRLMRSHKRIPNWLKPVSNDTIGTKQIVSELTFMGEKLDGGKYKEGLNNVIDWRPTIATAYQGKRPRQIFIDEPGSIDEMDLVDWWTTVKEQLALGKRVFGRAYLPTTLEDMKKKGGPLFAKIWDESDPMERDDNGRTRSGLYRYFKPFYEGREGFIDEYGNSLKEDAIKFRDNQLKHATDQGARKIRRQYPATVEEAFDVVLSDFWEEDVKDILKQSYTNSVAFPGIEYVKLVSYGTQLLVSNVKEHEAAVKVIQRPKSGVKYGVGIDSIGTDNQTGDEGGSALAVVVIKGFDIDEYAYAPVCSYIFRPDKMEDAYSVVANIIKWYGAEAGKDLLKAIGETNAGATNLLNYLINQGLKQFMAPKPKSIGVQGVADQAQSDKYWLYRTDDVKEYQRLLANRFLRKHGHKIRIRSLCQSLLDCGLRNADEADAFLMGLIQFQDFDAVQKENKRRTSQKWEAKWDPDKNVWNWELVNC